MLSKTAAATKTIYSGFMALLNCVFLITSSLIAVIAPLLLLFGLKFGIVSQLQDELEDIWNLEIEDAK